MQQRSCTMDSDDGDNNQTTPRGRHNTKLKVLVRSHAMREEASPPREPSPNSAALLSPCIKLTPSPEVSPDCTPSSPCNNNNNNPLVVLSPSISRGNSPARSSTSPRHSPSGASSQYQNESPKVTNLNKQNLEKDKSSQKNGGNRKMCDCYNQNCIKCLKGQERNNNSSNSNNNNSLNTLTVNAKGRKLRQQSSSLGSFESSSNSPCLSRDSSSEQYTDTTGVDLELFIPETLNRNAKDRALMLRIEQELVNLAKDKVKTHYKFPPMSSYQRMLVHRCAAYFGMDHNIESSGKCVVVNKTKNTRIPDVEFKEHIKEDIVFSEEPRRSILKRDSSNEDYNFKSPERGYSMESRRSKSFEEREEEYEKARRRIFNREMQDGSEEFGWSEMTWSSTESDYPRFRLQVHPSEIHHHHHHRRHAGKLTKVQSEETGETLRPYVAKSYSFGGYGGSSTVLNRGDSIASSHSAGGRLLTKQDSAASSVSWRLSPSSSGYKSQSQMSESATPSPTSTPHPLETRLQGTAEEEQVVWAVTDIHNVPKGSLIINPHTGKPLKNEDGSLYHYDPNNPPPGFIPNNKPPPSPSNTINKEHIASPKKRSTKSSPQRKQNVTNSSTSPILPYSPPLIARNTYQFAPGAPSDIPSIPQQYPVFPQTATYPPPEASGNVVYQQPYIVYSAPFSTVVPTQQFDARIDQPPMAEVATTYYVPTDGPTAAGAAAPAPPAQQLTYHQPQGAFWNQQFYQNTHQTTNSSPQQRYSMPLPNQPQTGFASTGFAQNFVAPSATTQTGELLPLYPNQQHVQMVFPNTVPPAGNLVYQNPAPAMIYAQNPTVYSPYQGMTQSLPPYPNTPTPNSCTSSSVSTTVFAGHEPSPQQQIMTLNMQQMRLGSNTPPYKNVQCDNRKNGHHGSGKGTAKFPNKTYLIGSSQSSTGTNSPAATVVAGYCPNAAAMAAAGMYRTPPGTPPCQYGYQPNFNVPSMVFRPMNSARANTPGKASRSPTPASDISHFDRQRMSLPPNLYQGMPYVIHSDARFIPGRGQPTAYRQSSAPPKQQSNIQGSDNRYKGKKPKGNKTGLPPSGK